MAQSKKWKFINTDDLKSLEKIMKVALKGRTVLWLNFFETFE